MRVKVLESSECPVLPQNFTAQLHSVALMYMCVHTHTYTGTLFIAGLLLLSGGCQYWRREMESVHSV